ncbi:MAG TPA: condensation domain-containing protein, partial [Duganella sp.]|nr:condensation domain-containing protein [Duganella sp.]
MNKRSDEAMSEMDEELLALLLDEEGGHVKSEAGPDASGGDIPRRSLAGVPAPLSYGQRQLWLMHQLEPGLTAYNLVRAFRLAGALDVRALERALQALVARHDVLRTRFDVVDDEPVQIVQDQAPLALRVEALDNGGDTSVLLELRLRAAAGTVFDLTVAPLLFARVFRTAPDQHVLVIGMHHLVSDGWSNAVLMRDLAAGYRQALGGAAVTLPAVPLAY